MNRRSLWPVRQDGFEDRFDALVEEGFSGLVLFAFEPARFAVEPAPAPFFEAPPDDLAADDFEAAVDGLAADDFEADVPAGAVDADEAAGAARVAEPPDGDDRDRDRFALALPPMGSAPPTALIAPDAASPTAPAILPARLPTVFTTLPGSGITLSSCVRRETPAVPPVSAEAMPGALIGGATVVDPQ